MTLHYVNNIVKLGMFFHVHIFSGSSYNEKSESKKKGRPRVEVQELRIIPVSKAVKYPFWLLMKE